ncbi:MAG: hypothetical protein IPM24_19080 [Bryobacterales bacterium]|nr:hypothetical protein [Bryobacterales bacterium]
MQTPNLRRPLATILAAGMLVPAALPAAEHVVPPAALHQRAAASSAARDASLAKAARLFQRDEVRSSLRAAKLDPDTVLRAAELLSDEELRRLGERAAAVERDFAAGAWSNETLTYIVIALAAAVVVLVLK